MRNEPEITAMGPPHDPLDALLRSAQWPDEASDPLDRLLRSAEWPEPVGDVWQEARRRDRRKKRRRIFAAVGAAAAVLLAAVAIRSARDAGDKSSANVVKASNGAAPPAISTTNDSPKIVAPSLPSREVRLRMIFEQVRERSAADDAAIDRIVARRVAEPDGALEELVQPLLARRAEFEQRLLWRFGAFVGEREPAAVELLGCLGSEAALPLLLHERLKPATHAAAVRALLRLADGGTLARLERQEWDDDLREEITAALQSRDDNQTTASTLIFEKGDQSCLEFRSDSSLHAALF
jgi:hypothetical protein